MVFTLKNTHQLPARLLWFWGVAGFFLFSIPTVKHSVTFPICSMSTKRYQVVEMCLQFQVFHVNGTLSRCRDVCSSTCSIWTARYQVATMRGVPANCAFCHSGMCAMLQLLRMHPPVPIEMGSQDWKRKNPKGRCQLVGERNDHFRAALIWQSLAFPSSLVGCPSFRVP